MATILDTRRVRSCTIGQLCDYFKELQNQLTLDVVTQQTLETIERGSIAPKTFQVWLGVSRSPSAVAKGLQQRFSVLVRKHSIKHLGKLLYSKTWKYTWDTLGGTRRLLNVFSDLSVDEVRQTCKTLGKVGRGEDLNEKRECITGLFMGLQPSTYPKALFKTTDKRPFARYYRYLVPSCTKELVEKILDAGLGVMFKAGIHKSLAQYHPNVVQAQQIEALSNNTVPSKLQRLKDLFTEYPKAHGNQIQGFSASMECALTIFHTIVNTEAAELEDGCFVNSLVGPLLRRARKKKAKWSQIEEIIDLTMQYMEKQPAAGKLITATRACDVLHLIAIC